jgi:hypothetical protein
MPLFVTVTPGTTVSSSTTLDAATLNLLGTPSVDVTGTVDGGSVSITAGSVPLNSLATQANNTIVGNASGSSNSPTALDASNDFTLTGGTFQIKTGAVVEGKIGARAVTIAKFQAINTNRLLGRTTASSGDIEEITVGTGLTLSAGSLTSLRPAIASTTVLGPSGYDVPTTRATPQEITALTTSITTQQASSKVLVTFNISYSIYAFNANTSKYAFILTRSIGGGSDVEIAVPSSPLTGQVYGVKSLDPYFYTTQQNTSCIQYLDSPGSAAVVTYKLKIYGSTSIPLTANEGFFINRSTGDAASNSTTRATSQVILQEILV